jgi:heat shock protein HslJ
MDEGRDFPAFGQCTTFYNSSGCNQLRGEKQSSGKEIPCIAPQGLPM